MILIDSSVWIDYFNGLDLPHTRKVDAILGHVEIVTTELVVAEVLQGFRTRVQFEATRKVLDTFRFESISGPAIAIQAARNYMHLRSLGCTVRKTVDTLIATKCILSGFQLLHNDRDFAPFEKFLGLTTMHF